MKQMKSLTAIAKGALPTLKRSAHTTRPISVSTLGKNGAIDPRMTQ
jgi:hypothetical protein